jgi:ribosomal protein S19E (S16A)
MRVHSHRRVRALTAAQQGRNEQALPVERLCKFYPSGDMSGSIPVYVIQGFHTVNRTCLHVLRLAYYLEIGPEQLNIGVA